MTRAKKDLYILQVERDRLTDQVSDLAVERDWLALDLAGRDADRDRLEREVTDLKKERYQALHLKDSLFTHLAEVVASVFFE